MTLTQLPLAFSGGSKEKLLPLSLLTSNQLEEMIEKRGELGDKNAQLRLAQAAVEKAKLDLQYTRVFAPTSGYIANFNLRHGDVVSAYQPLFALIEDQTWWAQANVLHSGQLQQHVNF